MSIDMIPLDTTAYQAMAFGPLHWAAGAEHHHFTFGMINPAMAFFFSIAGSYLGLTCARFARSADSTGARIRWIALSAFALGGIGIWMMHFSAMIGFTVDGTPIAYDLLLTGLSLLIAIASVALGLSIAGTSDQSWLRLIPAGAACGIGVAAMHYTGMAAMNFAGRLDYDTGIVAASIVIAVIASTVALRFSAVIARRGSMLAASALMAVAVSGMHYTGMMAVVVEPGESAAAGGIEPLKLVIPILVLAAVGIVGLIFAVLGAPMEEDGYTPRRPLTNPPSKPVFQFQESRSEPHSEKPPLAFNRDRR